MIYDFMRVILFFDLPMNTKKDRRQYNQFRKQLIKKGYIMMQFSVYCKVLNNREAANKHVTSLEKVLPTTGQVRIMVVTEKQYASMIVAVGGKSQQEELVTVEPFLEL